MLATLDIKPGFYTLTSDRNCLGRWKGGDLVRFRFGEPEPIGGWQKTSMNTFVGMARGGCPLVTLNNVRYIAFGTNKKLYISENGILYDITPIRSTVTINNNPFSTQSGSAVVTVTDTAHGATDGDYVTFSGATAVAGLDLNAEYPLTYVDADTYTITAGSNASSTTTGGGASVSAAYQISVGASDEAPGVGWGAGTWGSGTWGTPRTTSAIVSPVRTWALSTWGEDLIANPRGGSIYLWDSSVGVGTRAAIISAAPVECEFALVSPLDRHLIAYGCTPLGGGDKDPMLVRWCTSEDYTDWTPSDVNDAGDQRLDKGSRILSAISTREQISVFTDTSLYSQYFAGPPDTYGWLLVGEGCGIAGPLARCEFNGRVYWQGRHSFFLYDGTLKKLDCDIQNWVFDGSDAYQSDKWHAARDEVFNEVKFFFCRAGASEISHYACVSIEDGAWSSGALVRTMWLSQSEVSSVPVSAGIDGYLYNQETSTTADGVAIGEYIESYDAQMPGSSSSKDAGTAGSGVGERMMHVGKIIPDFTSIDSLTITLKARKYPSGEQQTRGPFSVNGATKYFRPRIRGRQISVRIDGTSGFWHYAPLTFDVRPHGER